MKSLRLVLRLLALWVLASALAAGWALINVTLALTPLWLDVAFSAGLILALMRWTAEPAVWLVKRRVYRLASWAFVTLVTLTGLLWLALPLVANYWNRFPLNLIYLLPRLVFETGNAPILQLQEAYALRATLPLAALTQLVVACLVLGMAALATAIAGRVVWRSVQSILVSRLDPIRVVFSRAPIRSARWLARLRRLVLVALVLIFVVGLVSTANARIPEIAWQSTATGPDAPRHVEILVVDELNGMLYAVPSGGRVFRSSDRAASWQEASGGLSFGGVTALALDERDGTLYACSWEGWVFRSTDGGISWQRISTAPALYHVFSLVVHEQNGTLYAGSDSGVFRSADGGETWEEASGGLRQEISPGLMAIGGNVQSLALDERDNTLYAGTGMGWISGGVFRSTDGAGSWHRTAGLTVTYVLALAVDQHNGTLYAGTDSGVFRSTDGGESWQQASSGLTSGEVRNLALDERHGILYADANGGVFRSTDGGGSWQQASSGLTSSLVYALVLDERDGILYAGTKGGVFRSTDGGESWHKASAPLTSAGVEALAVNQQNGTLYAGTDSGVFRSTDGGVSWQGTSIGLTSTFVHALALDQRDGTLYVGAGGEVFRSPDAAVSWRKTNAELPWRVWALVLDERDGILYAATSGGVFRSTDGGETWQKASTGLTSTPVYGLALDERDGTVYAGTPDGVFRSSDGGASWEGAGTGLTSTFVFALAVDERDGALYAGTRGEGVFRSMDRGASWQEARAGLSTAYVTTLLLDQLNGTLYAGTGSGVFRSTNRGASWEKASAGLTTTDVGTLVLEERDGSLYAGTSGGVFSSADAGVSWHTTGSGLTTTNIEVLALEWRDNTLYAIASTWDTWLFRSPDGGMSWREALDTGQPMSALTVDGRDGALYAVRWDGQFRSTDGGESWQKVADVFSTYLSPDFLSVQHAYGVVIRVHGGAPVWATYGGGPFWARLAANLDLHQAALRPLPGGGAEALAAWGGTIARAQLEPGYYRPVPLAWLALRAWVWSTTAQPLAWARAHANWLLLGFAAVATLALTFNYTNLARPFGLPLWTTVLGRRRLDIYARPDTLDAAWLDWEQAIRDELLRYGDAHTDDLRRVPRPFRRYALRRYAETYSELQALEAQPGKLRLLAGDRLRRWHAAWLACGRELGTQPGLTPRGRDAVDTLAGVLAEALGLSLGPTRDFEAVRACLVEAPALRLNVPPRFPLVFVADPQPSARTVQMLVDAVDVLRETGYFALVVPLEPPVRLVDTAAELRHAVDRSPHVQDFIVVSQDDLLGILIARHPARALGQQISAQVDLTVVSPFVIRGPVPEKMFFGREAEVRTLVESAGSADFAIVGNRKVGKTSLLQRARARMELGTRVRPLMMDCQTVRDARGFFAAFEAQTELELPTATPEGLTATVTDLRKKGPPLVLLLDEVDAVLADEKTCGERLAATWRALAQSGICRFIFCGSTGLALRLEDPHSVFFNFPQPLPLGYLSPEATRLVITQPLEMLGILLEDDEALLDDVLALTSGHPNLVQYVGKGLVEAADRRGERTIRLADLTALRASTDFTEYYLETVWGAAGPLEKLITMVASPDDFGLRELETALAAHEVQVGDEELDTALKLLRIYAILEKRERTYNFVPRAFPDILHGTQEVERLIAQEKRRLMGGDV